MKGRQQRAVDLEETARLIDALERDLAQLKSGQGDLDHLRADVEQLRTALASGQAHEELHGGLAGLREKLHAASDELLTDAIRTGDYIARIGRLLGM
jgi:predicted nuclease with TOPRIM domain